MIFMRNMTKIASMRVLVCTELLLVVVIILLMLCDTTTSSSSSSASTGTVPTMEELMDQLEKDVLVFRDAVRNQLMSFTTSNTNDCSWLTTCRYANYDHCQSKFPNSKCYDSPFNSPSVQSACFGCPTRVDTTVSTIRLPADAFYDTTSNVTKIRMYEAICQTVGLDGWLEQYWDNVQSSSASGAKPWAMHYSSPDGIHRIYPASHTDDNTLGICRNYDPRMRPWYSAATSARRNVILLVDVAMTEGNRLSNMKLAMTRVINATTIADNIAIITFNATTVRQLYDGYLVANGTNKDLLYTAANNLSSDSSSSVSKNYNSFKVALSNALGLVNTASVDCSTAILLFTDDVPNSRDAINDLQTTIQQTENVYDSILLFAYTMSGADTTRYNFTCSGPTFRTGLWSKITTDEDVVPALAPYFEIFQVAHELQLQQQQQSDGTNNKDYVAWVEPYQYFEFGGYGTTVSAPVYDPKDGQLLGVVGIKYAMQDFEKTRGYNINGLLSRAREPQDNSICPSFRSLSPCTFQFNQRTNNNNPTLLCTDPITNNINSTNNGTDTAGTCTNNITISTTFEHETSSCCVTSDCTDFSSLWNNVDEKGLTYAERACCTQQLNTNNRFLLSSDENSTTSKQQCIVDGKGTDNTTQPSRTDPILDSNENSGTNIPAIVGSVVGVVIVLCVIGFILYRRRNASTTQGTDFVMPTATQPHFKNKVPFEDE